jgi:hypothetical protein
LKNNHRRLRGKEQAAPEEKGVRRKVKGGKIVGSWQLAEKGKR